jgi:hypothetical protein
VLRCRFWLLRPRHTSSSGGCALLINLFLERGFDLGYFLFTAKLVLHPADDDFRGEVGVGDHVAFRLLQSDRAVSASGVGAVVGIDGVVRGEHNPVSGVALKLGNVPDRGGSHEIISDGGSVPELGVEASKTKKLGVVPESNRLSKCVVRLSLPMDYRPQAF